MSRPTPNTHLRGLRRMSAAWLSETVTLEHRERTADATYGGSERRVVWSGEVQASVRPYDQFVSVLRDYNHIENTPVELVIGVRRDGALDVETLRAGDTVGWQGRTYVISFVNDAVWSDARALYVIAQRSG